MKPGDDDVSTDSRNLVIITAVVRLKLNAPLMLIPFILPKHSWQANVRFINVMHSVCDLAETGAEIDAKWFFVHSITVSGSLTTVPFDFSAVSGLSWLSLPFLCEQMIRKTPEISLIERNCQQFFSRNTQYAYDAEVIYILEVLLNITFCFQWLSQQDMICNFLKLISAFGEVPRIWRLSTNVFLLNQCMLVD